MLRVADGNLEPVDGGRSIYRCNGVEIDASQGCVKRNDQEQHLRQQSFSVLLYLIERRQRLVTREELIEEFWQGTAVTDNALAQCIADMRKALGDDPREPRFIKTIPKTGYRFIAALVEEPLVAPSPQTGVVSVSEPPPSKPRRPGVLVLLLAIATAAVTWLAVSRSTHSRVEIVLPQVAGRQALAVMYFENQSGRSDLNWLSEGLADMFIADLSHFERLTVLSRPQLQLLLTRMGHKPQQAIQLEDALEIARKSHAQEVLMGSFLMLGDKTLINVRLFESAGGKPLAAEHFIVDRPADIITQVDLLAPKLAAQLGTPASAAKRPGLAEAMTNNVEAYRYYSLGVGKVQAFQNAEGVALLRKTVQLDPEFAMAYARIGYAYSVSDFLPEKGLPFLEKAMRLSGHLTAKDRLYVTAWDAIARKDYPGAIRTLEQVVDTYPAETEAYARLARLLYGEERPQEAIAVLRRGLTIDPDNGDLYNVLGICFLGLRRYDEAVSAHRRYVERAPNEPNSHDSLGMSFQQSGNYESALSEYDAALALDPEFEPSIIHMGDLYAQQGRYHEAIKQYERYVRITSSDAARAVGYGSIAQVYRRNGDFVHAAQASRDELRSTKGAVWNSLLAALDRGDVATAMVLKARLIENVPYPMRGSRQELRSYDFYLGTLALRDKQPDRAIAHFQEALRHLPPSSGLDLYEDCLAGAYLQLGRLDEAITEYKRILKLNPYYALADYHIAQAYQRKSMPEQSKASYERFLQVWKSADSDNQDVTYARKQLSLLGSTHAR